MLSQEKGSGFFIAITLLLVVIVSIFILFFSKNPGLVGKASLAAIEKCNNMDDNHNGRIDEGCDDDKDNLRDRNMICNGFYRTENNQLRSCNPEMVDFDDATPNI